MTSAKDQRQGDGKKVKPRPLPDVLDRLLQQLHRRDQYLFFAQPVSEKDVPDYHFHIKRPMDLGTMQSKFDQGLYTTLDAFKEDFLLVTRNAQYYNLLEGPSAIVHTEAKRLEEWGLKALEKETPAVEEAQRLEQEQKLEEQRRRRLEQESQQGSPSVSRSNGVRLSLKIRKNSSWNSSGPGTPRVSTPSRLQNEIKLEKDGADDDDAESRSDYRNGTSMDLDEAKESVDHSEAEADDDKEDVDDEADDDEDDEEEDDDDEDDDDEDDEDDDDGSVSQRAGSLSFDDTGSERAPRSATIIRVKKKRRSGTRRNKKGMFKKGQQRESAVVKLLSVPNIGFGDDKSPSRRPLMAPVSTTSAAVSSYLQLTYRPDGSINLDALLDDERRTLLRPAGLDAWPDLLTPFLHSLVPLHPDILPNAQALARDVKQMIDGFGTAIAGMALSPFVSYSHDLFGRSAEQQKLPFGITSGWMFDSQDSTKIPAAWPRLAPSNASSEKDGKGDAQQAGVRPPRKDKERERDEEGLATLDDWTWPRAHLSRLQEALDVGLYPGLLPAAWISHINSQKGGPSRSRLPPFHLAAGTAFDSAILDELASLPHRALLGGKPGIISVSASQPGASPMDVTVALEQAAERDWMPRPADLKKLGARGSDVVREAVYGGPVGEAYASSMEEFVRGASRSAEETFEDESEDEEEERARQDLLAQSELAASEKAAATAKGPSSYFDENGEMLEQDAYIGVDLIPLEIRKDAGVALEPSRNTSVRPSPMPTNELNRGQKRSRSHSTFTPPPKKQQTEELGISSNIDDGNNSSTTLNRNENTKVEEGTGNSQPMEMQTDSDPTSQPLGDPLLEKPLIEFVRDLILTPLTQGQLATLVEIGDQFRGIVNDPPTQSDGHSSRPSDVKQENGPSSLQENNKFVEMRNETVRKAVRGDYFRGRLQMSELIRAQGNAMDIDKVARNQGDIQAALTLEASPLAMYADDAIPHPRTSDVEMILTRYAGALERLAAMDAEQGVRTTEQQIEREKQLERLRTTYIALAKRASKLHVVPGQWSKWLEAAQKQTEGGMAASA